MGMIVDGIYYKDKLPEKKEKSIALKSIHEQNKLEREYAKHAHNLIQPNNPDGTPNQDFIDYFPDDAKNHGFIPESE